jgi:hypothetical protein
MIPKVSRCTVDILSQILSGKTIDVGKQCGLCINLILVHPVLKHSTILHTETINLVTIPNYHIVALSS